MLSDREQNAHFQQFVVQKISDLDLALNLIFDHDLKQITLSFCCFHLDM